MNRDGTMGESVRAAMRESVRAAIQKVQEGAATSIDLSEASEETIKQYLGELGDLNMLGRHGYFKELRHFSLSLQLPSIDLSKAPKKAVGQYLESLGRLGELGMYGKFKKLRHFSLSLQLPSIDLSKAPEKAVEQYLENLGRLGELGMFGRHGELKHLQHFSLSLQLPSIDLSNAPKEAAEQYLENLGRLGDLGMFGKFKELQHFSLSLQLPGMDISKAPEKAVEQYLKNLGGLGRLGELAEKKSRMILNLTDFSVFGAKATALRNFSERLLELANRLPFFSIIMKRKELFYMQQVAGFEIPKNILGQKTIQPKQEQTPLQEKAKALHKQLKEEAKEAIVLRDKVLALYGKRTLKEVFDEIMSTIQKDEEEMETTEQQQGRVQPQEFEANKHRTIGGKAFGELLKANETIDKLTPDLIDPTFNYIYLAGKGEAITAGDWVALAGDFYGIPEEPISGGPDEEIDLVTSKTRFLAAYKTLADVKGTDALKERDGILEEIEKEEDVVKKALRNKESIPDAIQHYAEEANRNQAGTTAFTQNVFIQLLIHYLPLGLIGITSFPRYLNLAKYNFDHFGTDAQIAYEAGHLVAVDTAREAYTTKRNDGNDEAAKKIFLKALTQELFACHFLTDLFSAGHMRVPRKELYHQVKRNNPIFNNPAFADKTYEVAGVLSLMMHHEDGKKGLWVKSKAHPKGWFAKGDGCLYEDDTKDNENYAIEAVKEALLSICDIYQQNESNYDFREYLPTLDNDKATDNGYALFCKKPLQEGQIKSEVVIRCRGDLGSREHENYTSTWSAEGTLAKLSFFGKAPGEDATLARKAIETLISPDVPARMCTLL